MSRKQLIDRLISTITGIDLGVVKNPRCWTQEDWQRIMDARDRLGACRLKIDTRPGLTTDQMAATSRRWALQDDVRLVVVDYLSLIPTPLGMRTEATGNNCLALKNLAKELGIPVILVAQLNRGVERRENKEPVISDLKDSGDIEQHADTIIFMYRPHYYDKSKPRRLAYAIVAKNRQGPDGRVELLWYGEVQLFTDTPTLAERRAIAAAAAEAKEKRAETPEEKTAQSRADADRREKADAWRQKLLPTGLTSDADSLEHEETGDPNDDSPASNGNDPDSVDTERDRGGDADQGYA